MAVKSIALALIFAAGTTLAASPDAVLPSTPQTVVRGYIASDTPPVLRIKSGQSVKIDTVSHGGLTDDPVAFFGEAGIPANQVLKDVIDIAKVTKERNWSGHVLTGPIYIEGAAPGDMLEVRILKVDIRVPYGVNNPGPGGAAPNLIPERISKVIKFDLARNVALFSKDVEIPMSPFMGIMAVAPPPEVKRVGSRAPVHSAATWISRNSRPGPPSTCRCSITARCSSRAIPTRARATVKWTATP